MGAVALGLSGARTIARAADAMAPRIGAAGHRPTGFFVQAMAAPGVELLVEAHHEIAELECNPLVVSPDGALAVDVRARVEIPPAHAPEPSLQPAG